MGKKKKIETKETLINDFLEARTDDVPTRTALIKRLNKFLLTETDPQLSAILQIIKLFEFDDHSNNVKKCYEMAVPIFEYLDTLDEYERIDLSILSRVIKSHADYSKTYELFNKALNILNERCTVDPNYYFTLINLHYNLTNRILRAKFYDENVDEKLLEATFMQCYDFVMKVCKERNKLPQMYTLEIRRGLFYKNVSMVQGGMDNLRGTGDYKRIRAAKCEIGDYLPHAKGDFGTDLQNIITGQQILKRSEELGWTRDELAERLGIDYARLGRLVRGKEGMSKSMLAETAKVLGVNLGYLLGDETVKNEVAADPFMWDIQAKMEGATDIEKAGIVEAVGFTLNLMRKMKEVPEPI